MNPQLLIRVTSDAGDVVALASLLHSSLPPVSAFDDYPKIQNAYKFFVLVVGLIAVNWRGQAQSQPSKGSINGLNATKGA